MFIAYLVPSQDQHLVYEDGVGFLEIGATQDEAEKKLWESVKEAHPEHEWLDDLLIVGELEYKLHTVERN